MLVLIPADSFCQWLTIANDGSAPVLAKALGRLPVGRSGGRSDELGKRHCGAVVDEGTTDVRKRDIYGDGTTR